MGLAYTFTREKESFGTIGLTPGSFKFLPACRRTVKDPMGKGIQNVESQFGPCLAQGFWTEVLLGNLLIHSTRWCFSVFIFIKLLSGLEKYAIIFHACFMNMSSPGESTRRLYSSFTRS